MLDADPVVPPRPCSARGRAELQPRRLRSHFISTGRHVLTPPKVSALLTQIHPIADLYEHILSIQNAADLEWPAIPQSGTNSGVRDEFLLGIFPPGHGGNHTPPPTPPPATPHP
jgi:hypothetical protein